ncbi:energy transducer TonB [Cerasicoccus maritimus]|uniref:energy transducer TonB n=1 Tax=Cerasicoccus maritimus TaxID=490089 RepID=UPI00285256BF|nr:energy transducer TonB [Cerasicoccus maritimus]
MADSSSFKIPTARSDLPLGIVCGVALSLGLFVLMAAASLAGIEKPETTQLSEPVMAFPAPEIDELEEPPEPPEPEEEPPPEMEEPPPEISLDQLEIALNPGTGGSLAGDFDMPTFSTSQEALGTEDLVDFSDLDQMPRLLDRSPFDFPARLRKKTVSGKIIVYLELNEKGEVTHAEVASSDLPKFNDFIVREVKKRKFSAPTFQGRPTKAKANLPIPVRIK